MNEQNKNRQGKMIPLFFLFLIFGLIAYLPETFSEKIPNTIEISLRIGVSIFLLVIAITIFYSKRLRSYWSVFLAFFIASTAQFLDWHFSHWVHRLFRVELQTPMGLALDKLESTLIIVATILLLNKIAGGDLASLFLKRGKMKQWIAIGLGAFAFFAATSFFAAQGLFGAQDLRMERVIPWIPWIFVFVLANGLNEELLFRGLLLRRFDRFLGGYTANLLIALIFAAWHIGVDYTPMVLLFSAITFLLGLAWGAVIQKTDSLWGSVIFHAGADIPVFIAILSAL